MSCGLGAVVLVFMLVKHNVDTAAVEIEPLTEKLQRLEQKETELQQTFSVLRDVARSEAEKIAEARARVSQLESTLAQKKSSLVRKQDRLAALKSHIKTMPIAKKEDVVEDDRGGEEEYLMGLEVKGRRIAVLLDSSASMTDERLIDIIRRKNGAPAGKRRGPKWVRAKRVVRWLLARAPKASQVAVVGFNDSVKTLGGTGWRNARDAAAIKAIHRALNQVVPQGPTNLQKGLNAVSRLGPTDLYVITDGLPTVGESRYAGLNPFARCRSLIGRAKTISGECRVKLFRHTIKNSAKRGVRANVILLPIEGDPNAANEYWGWASKTGGLLISPAENWP
uniref:von Willebrand factor type A domain-containing protein n=1 Tax=Candidatus Kentrum sp. MB TaxID=2138164 RepID=A0A450XLX1_9GAMM|nr:MAG: von Willebrand factor type A domain-containing protein [Candidatus Kentron sp. MB]VFK30264.1 MAG: von Willebrand factor type A domain-containing protein [Candidatus Kentron sp. MB]VFK75159.1 MAG: von Willebrand factor type A domain-containing protein [Candidatus Kentron sp. MB]